MEPKTIKTTNEASTSTESPKPKTWDYFPSCQNYMSFSYTGENTLNTWIAVCKSCVHKHLPPISMISNFHETPEELFENIHRNWFLLDKTMDGCVIKQAVHFRDKRKNWTSEQCAEFLSSQTKFLKGGGYRNKIYFRIIPSPLYTDEYQQSVFTSQVLEVIPLVLQKQNAPIKNDDARLTKYREKWAHCIEGVHNTIDLRKFERVLKKFNVDLSLLSIVEDPLYESTRRHTRLFGTPYQTVSPNGHPIMDTSQSIQVLFQKLVIGINWKKDGCKDPNHVDCLGGLKRKTKQSMSVVLDLKEPTFINTSSINKIIENSKNPCQYSTPIEFYRNLPTTDQIDIQISRQIAQQFDLPKFKNFLPAKIGHAPLIPIWMHRLFLNVGWLCQFLGEDSRFDKVFVHNLCHTVPDEYVGEARKFVIEATHGRSQWVDTSALH